MLYCLNILYACGDNCKTMVRQNRERVTIYPMFSLLALTLEARCPLKENSVVANDYRKKINSSSVDEVLELKKYLLIVKNNLLFFTIGTEKVFNSKN